MKRTIFAAITLLLTITLQAQEPTPSTELEPYLTMSNDDINEAWLSQLDNGTATVGESKTTMHFQFSHSKEFLHIDGKPYGQGCAQRDR